jgi:hypothetical protein
VSRDMVWGDIVPLGYFREWGIGPWEKWGDTVKWMQEIIRLYSAPQKGLDHGT